ncbi:MAG: flippase [Chloroflexota bacterium]
MRSHPQGLTQVERPRADNDDRLMDFTSQVNVGEPAPSSAHGKFALLGRGSLYNLLSFIVPLAVALVATPYVLHGFGPARFGLLTLVWLLVGYLSVFDLGLARATTRFVAELLEHGQETEIPIVAWSSALMIAMLGLCLSTLAQLFVGPLASVLVAGSEVPQLEAQTVLSWAFWSLPLLMVMAVARGVLEAEGRFGTPSAVRIVLAVAVFLVPVATLAWSRSLVAPVVILILLRVVMTAILAYLAIAGSLAPRFSRKWARLLARYGGWVALNNVLTPTVIYGDRVVIASTLGSSAVAYYAPAFEVVNRLLLVPTAIITILFPALSRSLVAGRVAEARRAFEETLELLGLVFIPVGVLLLANAEQGLSFWLGDQYASVALVPLQILTVGIVLQAYGAVGTALLQASKSFSAPSRIQLWLLLPYLVVLVALTGTFGLIGAALAWSSRALVEAIWLTLFIRRTAGTGPRMIEVRSALLVLLAVLGGIAVGWATRDVRVPMSLLVAVALGVGWLRYVVAQRTIVLLRSAAGTFAIRK